MVGAQHRVRRHKRAARCSWQQGKYAMLTWPGFARARALFVLLTFLVVEACTQLDRLQAVPVADTDRARIAGISEARFFASDTAALDAFASTLIRA